MKKTYEKPVLSKHQKLSSVVAATVASNVDL
ncbi:putative RiPP precursor [Mesorhizobium sp.]|nr:putative RiPP precursor [Mesorhizobium sp.]